MFDFTIVTPCKNMVTTIDETIWSVISQVGGHSIRYHIQDAVSTDGTLEKLQEWATRLKNFPEAYPSRIEFSYNSEADSGMYDAIHKAFATTAPSEKTFVGWLNGDDLLWPGTVDAIVNLAKFQPGVSWITGFPSVIDQYGKVSFIGFHHFFPRQILAAGLADTVNWHLLQQESTFWRYGLYTKVGGLNTELKYAGDWDLWRRFAQHSVVVHVQRQLGCYRSRPGQMSNDIDSYWTEIDNIISAEKRVIRKQAIIPNASTSFEVFFSAPLTDSNKQIQWVLDKIDMPVEEMAAAECLAPKTNTAS